jgi:hypothetical protein
LSEFVSYHWNVNFCFVCLLLSETGVIVNMTHAQCILTPWTALLEDYHFNGAVGHTESKCPKILRNIFFHLVLQVFKFVIRLKLFYRIGPDVLIGILSVPFD